jgi:RNA 2',3'-cyclic 3'-phosphodiesterase
MGRAEFVRIFVALAIPEPVRAALDALIVRLRPAAPGARWVRSGNLHVTLKFIGEVSLQKLEEIKLALRNVRAQSGIDILFRGIGFFPTPRRPRVFWAGVEGGPELAHLASSVEAALEPLSIANEVRAFSPHLTLARIESIAELRSLPQAIAATPSTDFGSAYASDFNLYQSVLKRGGAEYTQLASYRFAEVVHS